MGSITDIKSALTEKALRFFYETYHIPDEVHPQLPNLDQTIHEMPTGKIGVYTRLFKYANFRLPLSTFFVDVLRYYRIHISQLSAIGVAKASHFEVLFRAHGFEPTVELFRCLYVNSKNKGWMSFSKRPGNDTVCYTKPLDSLKNWNDRFFWVDTFACPASFPWNTSKSVPKDPFPKSSEFNAEHYAILVAHPAPFYTLDENTYPQFLRDNDEGKACLLSFGDFIAEAEADSFIRPSVPLMTMTTSVTSAVDPTTTAKDKLAESSIFGDGSSSGADHTVGLIGRSVVLLLLVMMRAWWGRTCDEMVDEFAKPREKRRLSAIVEEKNLLLKTRDEEVANLKAQLLVKEAEATEAIRLRALRLQLRLGNKRMLVLMPWNSRQWRGGSVWNDVDATYNYRGGCYLSDYAESLVPQAFLANAPVVYEFVTYWMTKWGTDADGQSGNGAECEPFPSFDRESGECYGMILLFSNLGVVLGLECITPTAEFAWVDCLHFVHVTLLKVANVPGMPTSAGMTAFVPYVNENGVSTLLDFIIVRCP
ncbi:hypothetical protein Tco_0268647 [Tanacetum coccineum]